MRILLLGFFICFNSFAQDLPYPELNVTPRASDRISLEAKRESEFAWSQLMAIQISSLGTMIAGGMGVSVVTDEAKDRGEDIAPTVALGVGGLWLGASVWTAMSHRPYRQAYYLLKKLPKKSKRDQLTLERLAEEEINSLRRVAKRARWLSAVSNLAANAFVMGAVESESGAQVAAGTSALLSIASIFFPLRWETVADEQEKYKKRIFSPVALIPASFSSGRETYSGLSLHLTF